MMLQLDPPIPVETPRGNGMCHVLIDNGTEHDLQWVCFIDKTRECWTFRNRDVRAQENVTMGRAEAPGRDAPSLLRTFTVAVAYSPSFWLRQTEHFVRACEFFGFKLIGGVLYDKDGTRITDPLRGP